MAKDVNYNSLKEDSMNRPSYKEVRRNLQMASNSINDELKDIEEKYESSLKKVIDAKKMRLPYPEVKREHPHPFYIKDESKPIGNNLTEKEAKNYYDTVFSESLSAFNESLLKGDFDFAKMIAKELNYFTKDSKLNKVYAQGEKEKFVDGIDRRIERGVKYLKKHPSRGSLEEMKEILKYRNSIETNLNNKRTGLEKSLAVLSIGSILAGIFLLSPNLTGNIIGNVAKSSGNILGGVLFILGIVGAFFTLRK